LKILFITSNRLGDAVISSGILDYLGKKYPSSEITVFCGPLAEGIFKPFPHVKEVIALSKEPYAGHWRKLWVRCINTNWDIIVDLRDSAVSRLLRANKRYIWGKQDDKNLHKVEQNAAILKLKDTPAPTLYFSNKTIEKAKKLVPDGKEPILALGPAANWPGKTWPAENFIELIGKITSSDGVLPNARIAVFAAPGEEDIAYQVLNSVPESRRIDVIAKGKPEIAAAGIQRCDFYIGNDSGLMHCAAAAGVPTLGLFGPSYPHLYQPWGKHAAYISTPETFDELVSYEGYDSRTVTTSLMGSLTIEAAYKAACNLWKSINKDD